MIGFAVAVCAELATERSIFTSVAPTDAAAAAGAAAAALAAAAAAAAGGAGRGRLGVELKEAVVASLTAAQRSAAGVTGRWSGVDGAVDRAVGEVFDRTTLYAITADEEVLRDLRLLRSASIVVSAELGAAAVRRAGGSMARACSRGKAGLFRAPEPGLLLAAALLAAAALGAGAEPDNGVLGVGGEGYTVRRTTIVTTTTTSTPLPAGAAPSWQPAVTAAAAPAGAAAAAKPAAGAAAAAVEAAPRPAPGAAAGAGAAGGAAATVAAPGMAAAAAPGAGAAAAPGMAAAAAPGVAAAAAPGVAAAAAPGRAGVASGAKPEVWRPRYPFPQCVNTTLSYDVSFVGKLRFVQVGTVRFAYHRFGPLRPGGAAAEAGSRVFSRATKPPSPVMFISGWGLTMYMWPIPLLQRLAESREVVIFDNMRTGLSNDSSTAPLSIEAMASATVGLIAALNLTTPDIWSWSLGGFVAYGLLAAYEDKIGNVIVAASSPGGPDALLPPRVVTDDIAAARQNYTALLPYFFPGGAADPGVCAFYAAYNSFYASQFTSLATPLGLNSLQEQSAAVVRYFTSPSIIDQLDGTPNRVLILHGVQDRLMPVRNAMLGASRLLGAWMMQFPGEGHGIPFSNVQAVTTTTLQFFSFANPLSKAEMIQWASYGATAASRAAGTPTRLVLRAEPAPAAPGAAAAPGTAGPGPTAPRASPAAGAAAAAAGRSGGATARHEAGPPAMARSGALLLALALAAGLPRLSSAQPPGSRQQRFAADGLGEDGLGEDPGTWSTATGIRAWGTWAYTTEKAEALSGAAIRGVRYEAEGGRVVNAGIYPNSRSVSTTGGARAVSGNYPGKAVMVLGTHVIAATELGARAVAGSGVSHTAAPRAATASNLLLGRPETVVNRGSAAFTDTAPGSAATAEQGNGAAVVAWGREAVAASRSQQLAPFASNAALPGANGADWRRDGAAQSARGGGVDRRGGADGDGGGDNGWRRRRRARRLLRLRGDRA
ncbi:hypothetical protein HT031_006719 [Scenedesmus sp. PABB004]|nr:hypothetical protein HT031_006719 [Scenedesmus sp. PABB004]